MTDEAETEIIEAEPTVPAAAGTHALDVSPSHVTRQRSLTFYVALPLVFLTVALLGGMRIAGGDLSFVFLKPPLFCLIFSAALMALFFRSGAIRLGGWLSEDLGMMQNAANAIVLVTLFAACTQLFNAVIPEQGISFWVVGFCFFWTLWNNLFADFDRQRLFRSLAGLFSLAFIIKFVVLAGFASTAADRGFIERILQDPSGEALTYLLDIPRFSPATGYLQFFTCAAFLLGLLLLPSSPPANTTDRLEKR
jgi:hypothetical protein